MDTLTTLIWEPKEGPNLEKLKSTFYEWENHSSTKRKYFQY